MLCLPQLALQPPAQLTDVCLIPDISQKQTGCPAVESLLREMGMIGWNRGGQREETSANDLIKGATVPLKGDLYVGTLIAEQRTDPTNV